MAGNALAGPVLEIGCYQLALKTTPSDIVLLIVATAPLVTLVMARCGSTANARGGGR